MLIMEWLPSVLVFVVGLVLLVLLLIWLTRALARTRTASHTLTVAITGRTRRVKAALAEIQAWRAARSSGRAEQVDA